MSYSLDGPLTMIVGVNAGPLANGFSATRLSGAVPIQVYQDSEHPPDIRGNPKPMTLALFRSRLRAVDFGAVVVTGTVPILAEGALE